MGWITCAPGAERGADAALLTRYTLTLVPEVPCRSRPEWAYHLYAALLEGAPASFGTASHRDGTTPVSQYLSQEGERLVWRVTLLGRESEAALAPVLEGRGEYRLNKDGVTLRVARRSCGRIADVEELFVRSAGCGGLHRLTVRTPAAFKSRGHYQILPTPRLILQSLIKQWNGCFSGCPIEDEDGAGMETMAAGLLCRSYQLRDQGYFLKGNRVPGFVGSLTLDSSHLAGFHRTLSDALLYFSGYAGIGIKTALGMGGVEHRFCIG